MLVVSSANAPLFALMMCESNNETGGEKKKKKTQKKTLKLIHQKAENERGGKGNIAVVAPIFHLLIFK